MASGTRFLPWPLAPGSFPGLWFQVPSLVSGSRFLPLSLVLDSLPGLWFQVPSLASGSRFLPWSLVQVLSRGGRGRGYPVSGPRCFPAEERREGDALSYSWPERGEQWRMEGDLSQVLGSGKPPSWRARIRDTPPPPPCTDRICRGRCAS